MDRSAIFKELFGPLYDPIPDSGKYLERIGVDPIRKVDKESLDLLVLSHQRSVPFENLDIYDAGLDISLAIPELYDKIVLRRRGGYCFELNAAFSSLLAGLGYTCYSVAVRVVANASILMPLSHRASIVTIGGVRFFCDVGFGGPSPQGALLLDDTEPQVSGSNTFVVKKDKQGIVICRIIDGNDEPLLSFSDTPCDPVDFLALNEYQSKSKNSMFRIMRICNLVTDTGSITLSGNVLKIHSGNDTVEKTLETEGELRSALNDHYGVQVDFPLSIC